jgi:hypothetical protein
MEESYRFCAGVRNDSDPTHSAIVPFSRPRADAISILKMSQNVVLMSCWT